MSAAHGFGALGAAIAAMTCFALAMDRHHERVYGHAVADRAARMLRVTGWMLLALSIVPCVRGWGASIGAVVWVGCVCAAALAVTPWLTWCPRFVPLTGTIAAAIGLSSWLLIV